MNRVLVFVFIYSLATLTSLSQPLAAFVNYRGALVVLENGAYRQLDHLTPAKIYTGGNSLAYLAHDNALKLYYKQQTYTLNDSPPDSLYNGDYLLSYLSYRQLKVFDSRKVKTLSGWVENFWPADSLVVFEDNHTGRLMVYQNLRQQVLEESVFAGAVKNLRASVNIVAYANTSNLLSVFYQDSLYRLTYVYGDNAFAAGQNVVAYIRSGERVFELFYKGLTYTLEELEPKNYLAGRDLVAYVAASGEFKAFCNGSVYKINSFQPREYMVKDSLVYFTDDQNYFHVFMNGQTYTLENFMPDVVKASWGTVAYLDQQGRLKVFYNGISRIVTYDQVSAFSVQRNLVQYHTGLNNVNFYYAGEKLP